MEKLCRPWVHVRVRMRCGQIVQCAHIPGLHELWETPHFLEAKVIEQLDDCCAANLGNVPKDGQRASRLVSHTQKVIVVPLRGRDPRHLAVRACGWVFAVDTATVAERGIVVSFTVSLRRPCL